MSEPYEHRAPTRAELRADLNELANWLTEESTNAVNAMQLSRWADAAGEAVASLAVRKFTVRRAADTDGAGELDLYRTNLAEARQELAHERRLAGQRLQVLWKAVHDAAVAPPPELIMEDELICAVQDADTLPHVRGDGTYFGNWVSGQQTSSEETNRG